VDIVKEALNLSFAAAIIVQKHKPSVYNTFAYSREQVQASLMKCKAYFSETWRKSTKRAHFIRFARKDNKEPYAYRRTF